LEGLTASIGSVGDAYDNAAAETVMGALQKRSSAETGSPFRLGSLETLTAVEELSFDSVDG
jgi:hypothetical protein